MIVQTTPRKRRRATAARPSSPEPNSYTASGIGTGSSERAIVAFEESDGISGYNHTLEKEALFGMLLAIEMMTATGKNLSVYLKEIMDEFGHFYPDRSGISVDRSLVGDPLIRKLSVISEHYRQGFDINYRRTDTDCKKCYHGRWH